MELIKPGLGMIFWTVIVFGMVLFILRKYAWDPILQGLKDREETIEGSLREAEQVRREMKELKAGNEDLLNLAKEERAKLLREAKETRDKIVGEAKDKAKAEASKVIADARDEIENQKMAAITEVKNQVGNMAIDIAERMLKKELSDKVQQEKYIATLIDEYNPN